MPARLLEIASCHDWRELCLASSFLALLENSKLCLSALELWLELQVKLQMLELSSNLTIFFPLPNGVSCLHPPLLRVHRAAALRGGSSLFLLQSIPLFIHAALLPVCHLRAEQAMLHCSFFSWELEWVLWQAVIARLFVRGC